MIMIMDFAVGPPALAGLAPDPHAALEEVLRACHASVDPADLELIGLRVAQLLGDERGLARRAEAAAHGAGPEQVAALDRWWSSPLFGDRDRALLGFVDQFVFSVSSMSDADVDALLATETPVRVHELANAVWAIELSTRLDLVSRAVLS
jgi:alkylhydroperoxidase family enzyme